NSRVLTPRRASGAYAGQLARDAPGAGWALAADRAMIVPRHAPAHVRRRPGASRHSRPLRGVAAPPQPLPNPGASADGQSFGTHIEPVGAANLCHQAI